MSKSVITIKGSTRRERKGRSRGLASKGKTIRLSDEVLAVLRKHQGRRSFDVILRDLLGLPQRVKDEHKPLLTGCLVPETGEFFLTEGEARGAAVVAAAKSGRSKVSKPIRMREVRWFRSDGGAAL